MSSLETKEEKLWRAATDGDLETIKRLCADPAVDVNWSDSEYGRTPLYRASGHNQVAAVKLLLQHEALDPQKPNIEGGPPLFVACQEGHAEVVALLLADPRVDPNQLTNDDRTGFFKACSQGRVDVAVLMLADERVDVNRCRSDLSTPLWFASQNGHLQIVRHLLASSRAVDTGTKSLWNNSTAAEQARKQPAIPRQPSETAMDVERRKVDCPLIADLIDEYERNPEEVRMRMRLLLGFGEPYIGQLFALLVFYSDGFVRASGTTPPATSKFLAISSQLPLDLQMVLCNRVFGSSKNIVRTKHSELGFKWLARAVTWSSLS